MNRDERKQFARYIGELREKRGITMKQLCRGLCSDRNAMYIERGERDTPRVLREALLERLGVGAEDYECYLGCEDYARWKMQQQIIHCIIYEKTGQAEAFLEKYRDTCCTDEDGNGSIHGSRAFHGSERNLEQQFILSMQAQIQNYRAREASRDGGRAEAGPLFREALGLTVPAWEESPVRELVLSLKELNLLLEAERCREQERPERYREVLDYLVSTGLDRRGMAKIYPKVVYFLCRRLMEEYGAEEGDWDAQGQEKYRELLVYCNRALEILRDNGRMYFLWEILDMRERLFDKLEEKPEGWRSCRHENEEAFLRLRQENVQWKQVLEAVCEEFRVPKETFEYCYLYLSRGVSCTNDVIRIRSRMLGLDGEELCEGVCSTKTLWRIRKNLVSPQRAVAEGLFEKLGLPGELVRTDLVTGIPEARKLMEKLREDINGRRWEEAEKGLERIKQLVSLDITCNRQAVRRKEILLCQARGEIDKTECCRQLREALELTLPYKAFLEPGEKYLTTEEQSCIENMMTGMDKGSEEFRICMERFEELYQPIIDRGELENVEGVYKFIMGYLASCWGNMGEFDKADAHDLIIIEGCLRNRRMWSLDLALYDRWWNHAERRKKGIPTNINLDDELEITKCIRLGRLAKSHRVPAYQKKLRHTRERD